MRLILPYPPSANRYWRVPRPLGYPILSREAREYKHNAGLDARSQGAQVLEGPIAVTVDVYRPRRAGDLDNRIKVVLDTLNGVAWRDDDQITELHMRRFDDKAKPRLEVVILPIVEQKVVNEKDGSHDNG